jgi:hypothetical protein
MVAPRRFCRFRRNAPADSTEYFELPDDGFCLNVFVLVHPAGQPGQVLAGRPDPAAPWGQIASLNGERIAALKDRWMLPASQLQFFEGPDQARDRVLADQMVGIGGERLRGPSVFSEPYERTGSGHQDPHWDLHFVYEGEASLPSVRAPSPWRELAFVDLHETPRAAFGRGHADILALAGMAVRE